jgi:deoxyribodipyrimidine photo-lyase
LNLQKEKIVLFWFRRDLRLADNHGLHVALKSGFRVLPIFIFDENIIEELNADDPRLNFIYDSLASINEQLSIHSSGLLCLKGKPQEVWKYLIEKYDIHAVYSNEDYEPYAIQRDSQIAKLLKNEGISFHSFKDQVIFEKDEVIKQDGHPYTVYTPYKNKWLEKFHDGLLQDFKVDDWKSYLKTTIDFPSRSELGINKSSIEVLPYNLSVVRDYENTRNYPAIVGTSSLSPHLRFGTVSIREMVSKAKAHSTFLSELIWREFFMQILYHFPKVVDHNFKQKYDGIQWRNNEVEFEKWKNGETGYPIVDAGMRELNATGYMHNRVRMITAGFLCKHLLIDWRWGEAYFAEKLLDYELSANNGNWQWSAGTGCDAAPYFRIFNPTEQVKKFDPELKYIRKWVTDLDDLSYPLPIVEHKFARERALKIYKEGIQ